MLAWAVIVYSVACLYCISGQHWFWRVTEALALVVIAYSVVCVHHVLGQQWLW